MVRLQFLNLAEAWGSAIPPADIIFLRNVLIYFDVETRKAILARIRRVLRPDGFLFLGCAETTLNLDLGFRAGAVGKLRLLQAKGPVSS